MSAFDSGKDSSLLERHPVGFRSNDFPRWAFAAVARRVREYRRLRISLARLKDAADRGSDLDELFDEVQRHSEFCSDQKKTEILPFLSLLAKTPPHYLCEIGSSFGGTLFMLARVCAPDATLISVDFGLSRGRSMIHRQMGFRRQQIVCISGDSQSPLTVERVASTLGKNRLDCLFIDGDHSLAAVTADFTNYSPFVRDKGIIALHDIVADHQTRYGINGDGWSGDVHKLWQQIRFRFRSEEFIESPHQDGYGLGVVHWRAP
jgi:predicted O-methyltransferase YrrM